MTPDEASGNSPAASAEPANPAAPAELAALAEPAASLEPAAKVDPRLLELLVCPLTKGRLEYDAASQELISRGAGLAYPIRDGIPIMLPDEARPLTEGA